MMTPTEYADHVGTTMRTVKRWISEGRLPEAVKGDDGRWKIPAGAVVRKGHSQPALVDAGALVRRRTSADLDRVVGAGVHEPPRPALVLDTLPALVELGAAAGACGVPESAVRTLVRDGRLDGVHVGSAHRLYVTQASLRRLMGR